MNPNQPLWLPPGSIRAVIGLLLVCVTCYLAVAGKISAEAFVGLAASVIAYYFASKAAVKS